MLKKLMTLGAGLVLSGTVLAASAANTIGVVDVQQIFSNSKSVQAAKTKLQSQFKQKKQEVQAAMKSLQAMMANYKKNASVMDASKRQAMQKQIAAKQSSIMQMQSSFQAQASQAEQKTMGQFIGELQAAAESVAKREHLTLVLPSNSVLYSDKTMDITDQVSKAFKQ